MIKIIYLSETGNPLTIFYTNLLAFFFFLYTHYSYNYYNIIIGECYYHYGSDRSRSKYYNALSRTQNAIPFVINFHKLRVNNVRVIVITVNTSTGNDQVIRI